MQRLPLSGMADFDRTNDKHFLLFFKTIYFFQLFTHFYRPPIYFQKKLAIQTKIDNLTTDIITVLINQLIFSTEHYLN